jgi:hypothetical protein
MTNEYQALESLRGAIKRIKTEISVLGKYTDRNPHPLGDGFDHGFESGLKQAIMMIEAEENNILYAIIKSGEAA